MLSHIWTSEDTWPAATCRDFIMEWAAVLDKRTQVATFEFTSDSPSHQMLLHDGKVMFERQSIV